MGRERREMSNLIDFVAVIDTPLEFGLARKVLRDVVFMFPDDIEKDLIAEKSVKAVNWVKDYLRGYMHYWRDLYFAVQKQVLKNCDLVIDGSLSVEDAAQQLIVAVKELT